MNNKKNEKRKNTEEIKKKKKKWATRGGSGKPCANCVDPSRPQQ